MVSNESQDTRAVIEAAAEKVAAAAGILIVAKVRRVASKRDLRQVAASLSEVSNCLQELCDVI